jgi:hypothetical protein
MEEIEVRPSSEGLTTRTPTTTTDVAAGTCWPFTTAASTVTALYPPGESRRVGT